MICSILPGFVGPLLNLLACIALFGMVIHLGRKYKKENKQVIILRSALQRFVTEFERDHMGNGEMLRDPDWSPLWEHYSRAKAALFSMPKTNFGNGHGSRDSFQINGASYIGH